VEKDPIAVGEPAAHRGNFDTRKELDMSIQKAESMTPTTRAGRTKKTFELRDQVLAFWERAAVAALSGLLAEGEVAYINNSAAELAAKRADDLVVQWFIRAFLDEQFAVEELRQQVKAAERDGRVGDALFFMRILHPLEKQWRARLEREQIVAEARRAESATKGTAA
jgi:hypothetical protein